MQQNLIKAIKDINHFIFATNTSNNMATPKLADDIIRSAGPNKNPRVHYNRLADGTHATSETNQKWASKIINAIEEDRTRHPTNQIYPIGTVISHHRSTHRITPRKPSPPNNCTPCHPTIPVRHPDQHSFPALHRLIRLLIPNWKGGAHGGPAKYRPMNIEAFWYQVLESY